MRWFFLLLLLANGVFFLWQRAEDASSGDGVARVLPASKGNLVLLAELPESLLDEEATESGALGEELGGGMVLEADQPVVSDEAAVVGVEECWFAGPYAKKTQIPDYAAEVPIRAMKEEYEASGDYWVYLGPYENVTVATNMREKLLAEDVDSFVIVRGELENAVSLGVFSDESRAKRLSESFVGRGYKPEVRRVVRMAERFWLLVQGQSSNPMFQNALRQLGDISGEAKKPLKKSCNLVASLKDFD